MHPKKRRKDHLSKKERSQHMAKIGAKNTMPELTVRKLIYTLGYRYRLHVRKLEGTPDIVFSKRKKVIFINGCFWHRHEGCKHCTTPKSRIEFWQAKFDRNVARDKRNIKALRKLGWMSLVIWSCEIRDINKLEKRVIKFLEN